MSDDEFLAAFEQGKSNGKFSHQDHLRVAWLLLRRHGRELGANKLADGFRSFTQALGVPEKYHETVTRFWAHVVADAMAVAPSGESFEAFLRRCEHLLDSKMIERHYAPEVLKSDLAKREYVAP
jgi:hypothetical protein